MRPENPNINQTYFSNLSPLEKTLHLIKFAILAPSAHNTQPWLFEGSEHSIKVFLNKKRVLPVSDPTGRQAHLSVGAAISNIMLAAKYYGCHTNLNLIPGSNDQVAEILIEHGKNPVGSEEDIKALLQRHSSRLPYQHKLPGEDLLQWIKQRGGQGIKVLVIKDQQVKDRITAIIGDAIETAMNNQAFANELSHWIKPSLDKFKDGMPGYNLGMPFPISLIFPFLLRKLKTGKVQKKMDTKILNQTPVFIVIATEQDSQDSRLRAGMIYEEIAVEAQRRSVKTAVMAAPVEVGDTYKSLQSILGITERPQMFLRLGYTDKVFKASPRLSLNEVLISR